MNYESTTFLFRNGSDDYTLWVVDLSKTELSRISRNNLTILGNLDDLMEQIPIGYKESDMNRQPYLLKAKRSQFALCTIPAPTALLRLHFITNLPTQKSKERSQLICPERSSSLPSQSKDFRKRESQPIAESLPILLIS